MRSKLFVPASRPNLFAKAMASAADAVSFDLEDAVEDSQKGSARAELAAFLGTLATGHEKVLIVRVNGTQTPYLDDDLDVAADPRVDVINLPMAESTDEVCDVADRLARRERERGRTRAIGLLVNIESARGLRRAAKLAGAHRRVVGLQIGFGDLFAPLGIGQEEQTATQYVRMAVRLAAGEAGLPAYDGAYVNIGDPEGFAREAQAARQLGFAGKSCIHPTQVAIANNAFRPSPAEVDHAVRVLESARGALGRGIGAFVVDGQLVDGPFITQAEKTVSLARRLGMLA